MPSEEEFTRQHYGTKEFVGGHTGHFGGGFATHVLLSQVMPFAHPPQSKT